MAKRGSTRAKPIGCSQTVGLQAQSIQKQAVIGVRDAGVKEARSATQIKIVSRRCEQPIPLICLWKADRKKSLENHLDDTAIVFDLPVAHGYGGPLVDQLVAKTVVKTCLGRDCSGDLGRLRLHLAGDGCSLVEKTLDVSIRVSQRRKMLGIFNDLLFQRDLEVAVQQYQRCPISGL